jgi:cob(I)alamin adenosyltransferase
MKSGLYTGKGDGGTTKFFGCDQKRVSKSSSVAEALGNLDELNSFLGVVKVKSQANSLQLTAGSFSEIIEEIQENIFIICANIAGSEKNLAEEKVAKLEGLIAECEKELPPIKVFTIAGGTELSAQLDYARTIARRAERRVVAVNDELGNVSPEILKYLNRLSSVLFALARLTNHRSGIKESSPSYE